MAQRSNAASRPKPAETAPARAVVRVVKPLPAPPAPNEVAAPAPLGLCALRVVALDAQARTATLAGPEGSLDARLEPSLDVVVVETALARGERLIAQREGGVWVVLGALRTAATPGVDRGDDYVIEARRIAIRGDHAVDLVAGETASIALRAVGRLEILAKHISSRAEGMHKLVARMIHMN